MGDPKRLPAPRPEPGPPPVRPVFKAGVRLDPSQVTDRRGRKRRSSRLRGSKASVAIKNRYEDERYTSGGRRLPKPPGRRRSWRGGPSR